MSYTRKTYKEYREYRTRRSPTKRVNAGARRSPALRNAQTEIRLRGKVLKSRRQK